LAEGRGRFEGGAGAVRRGEEEPGPAGCGRGAALGWGGGAAEEGETRGAGEGWVRAFVGARRARIDPKGKRAEYLRRLEGLMGRIDAVLDREGRAGKGELRAMDVMIRAVRACYVMVRDADVEAIERELEELEGAARAAKGGAGGELGYGVEEDAPR